MNEQVLKRDWFYWIMAVFTVSQLALSAIVLVDILLHPLAPEYYQPALLRLFLVLAVPVMTFIAVLVVRRVPRNVTGFFILLMVTITIGAAARQETNVLLIQNLSFGWVGLFFLPLFFPDGRAFPQRFEPHIRLLCVGLILSLAVGIVSTPVLPSENANSVPNPLHISALERLSRAAGIVEQALLIVILVVGFLSLVARFLGSDRRVRQQIKWLAWVFFAILVGTIPMTMTGIATREPQELNSFEQLIRSLWSAFLTLAPFFAVAIAILRYRLYDIDIIIRRTLLYSVLTVTLGVIYFAGVVLAQQVFRALTGQTSDLAIAVSTLLIAVLFTPLRRRIQNAIDLSLYRRKYDAERTLANFSQSLSDQVDIDTLETSLAAVLQETMQPSQVALWINDRQPTVMQETAPAVVIPVNDPLYRYCLTSRRAIEVDQLKMQSEAKERLKAAGFRLLIPLVNRGELVGALQLGARLSDQDYSSDDYHLLNTLAPQAAAALHVAQLAFQQQIEARRSERMEQELRVAGVIQQTLLPKDIPTIDDWELAVHWQPARSVSGDFYDFVPLADGRMIIFIGDVTDKGVPAALVMASTNSILRAVSEQLASPGEILRRANDALVQKMPPKMFATCLCALLDPHNGRIQYANAGHSPPQQITQGGVIELQARGMPLGLMPGMEYEEKETALSPGDSILMYSDGLIEAHNPQREMFGMTRLRALLEKPVGAETLIPYLRDSLTAFTGSNWEQEDDVTLVVIHYRAVPQPVANWQADGQRLRPS